MKFLDLFAGIGGFREGMTRAGHTPVGWCEIDKWAQKAYRIVHEPEGEWFCDDVRAIDPADLPDFDCICGGFPCQAFSIAGKRGGFADTRGTLFFEIMRLARARKPKYLFLENVRGLLSHDRGNTYATILNALAESGYDVQWQVLNSKDFGVPQNRERVFIIANLRGTPRPEVFPITGENENALKLVGRLDIKGMDCVKRVYSPDGLSPALTTMQGGNTEPKIVVRAFSTPDWLCKNQNGRRWKEPDEPSFTLATYGIHGVAVKKVHGEWEEATDQIATCLDANYYKGIDSHGQRTAVMHEGWRIRKLTPLECFRLQGFPDEWYHKLRPHISDTQMYKMAGNAVTVNVVEAIARRLPS